MIVLGKTRGNIRKRSNIEIITGYELKQKMDKNPNFKSELSLSDNF